MQITLAPETAQYQNYQSGFSWAHVVGNNIGDKGCKYITMAEWRHLENLALGLLMWN